MQKITERVLQDTMYYQEIPIFTYKIIYPHFNTTCSKSAGQTISEYYERKAGEIEQYCRTVLFGQAVDSNRYVQPNGVFYSYSLDVTYQITYNKGCVTSLYMDTYTYMGGAHGETKRTSDTWNFKTGSKLRLNDIYPFSPSFLRRMYIHMGQQVEERQAEFQGSYFENSDALIVDTFHPSNFYLRPGEIVIYFQLYDIAPYATGIPEFLFPLPDMGK